MVVLGICYPFVVYAALGHVPAGAFVVLATLLILGRLIAFRGDRMARLLLPPLLITVVATLLLAVLTPEFSVKAYPVLMSLCFASAFGFSLLHPPSLAEIFARRTQPEMTDEAVRYTRKVSAVWFGFLLINAGLSLATALHGDLALWTLYNGIISYILMGLLFAGELLVRQRVMARSA